MLNRFEQMEDASELYINNRINLDTYRAMMYHLTFNMNEMEATCLAFAVLKYLNPDKVVQL